MNRQEIKDAIDGWQQRWKLKDKIDRWQQRSRILESERPVRPEDFKLKESFEEAKALERDARQRAEQARRWLEEAERATTPDQVKEALEKDPARLPHDPRPDAGDQARRDEWGEDWDRARRADPNRPQFGDSLDDDRMGGPDGKAPPSSADLEDTRSSNPAPEETMSSSPAPEETMSSSPAPEDTVNAPAPQDSLEGADTEKDIQAPPQTPPAPEPPIPLESPPSFPPPSGPPVIPDSPAIPPPPSGPPVSPDGSSLPSLPVGEVVVATGAAAAGWTFWKGPGKWITAAVVTAIVAVVAVVTVKQLTGGSGAGPSGQGNVQPRRTPLEPAVGRILTQGSFDLTGQEIQPPATVTINEVALGFPSEGGEVVEGSGGTVLIERFPLGEFLFSLANGFSCGFLGGLGGGSPGGQPPECANLQPPPELANCFASFELDVSFTGRFDPESGELSGQSSSASTIVADPVCPPEALELKSLGPASTLPWNGSLNGTQVIGTIDPGGSPFVFTAVVV